MTADLLERELAVEGYDLTVVDYGHVFSIRWSLDGSVVAEAEIRVDDDGIEWTGFVVLSEARRGGFYTAALRFAVAHGPSRIAAAVPEAAFYESAGHVRQGDWLVVDEPSARRWLDARPDPAGR